MTGDAPLQWHACLLVRGHGVASGKALDSPYPAGTIALQTPLFAAHGLDLSPYHPGTLNLAFSDSRWQLSHPTAQIEQLHWSDLHPPETFSFWPAMLRWAGCESPVQGLLYRPHPETKHNHHHSPDRLELLAPWIDGIATAESLELGLDPRRCRRIRPLALQARLLEALKFRVLASQAAFFTALEQPTPWGAPDLQGFRAWLAEVMPAALDLCDDELALVLDRARTLYCDECPDGIPCDTAGRRSGLA